MSSVGKGTIKQRTIDRIKAGKLITRLEQCALTTPEDPDYINKQMTQGQISAARVVLAKAIPDLKQVEQIIKDDRKKTKVEVDAALLANGIDPEKIWKQVTQH